MDGYARDAYQRLSRSLRSLPRPSYASLSEQEAIDLDRYLQRADQEEVATLIRDALVERAQEVARG